MKVVDYFNSRNIMIEFQDEYKAVVKSRWDNFIRGKVKNPYYPGVCGHGYIGTKYPIAINRINIKEYVTWYDMLNRCFDIKFKEKQKTYIDVTCCDEWLSYENFYEWLHSQENFDKWLNSSQWNLDKDILVKGNKIYSPETCCLVPKYVNMLFVKRDALRGDFPIGVIYNTRRNMYQALTIYGKDNNKSKATAYCYLTPEDAFYLGYKPAKEAYIKRIAQEEYAIGNITEMCYNAMMNYEVEITD